MKYKKENKLQVLIDEQTFIKLNKLIAAEAMEKGTRIPSLSKWCRELITDTVDFELNKRKIDGFSFKENIKDINR